MKIRDLGFLSLADEIISPSTKYNLILPSELSFKHIHYSTPI
jgi:hypothetical protein